MKKESSELLKKYANYSDEELLYMIEEAIYKFIKYSEALSAAKSILANDGVECTNTTEYYKLMLKSSETKKIASLRGIELTMDRRRMKVSKHDILEVFKDLHSEALEKVESSTLVRTTEEDTEYDEFDSTYEHTLNSTDSYFTNLIDSYRRRD